MERSVYVIECVPPGPGARDRSVRRCHGSPGHRTAEEAGNAWCRATRVTSWCGTHRGAHRLRGGNHSIPACERPTAPPGPPWGVRRAACASARAALAGCATMLGMLRVLHTADVHLGARHADLGNQAAAQ